MVYKPTYISGGPRTRNIAWNAEKFPSQVPRKSPRQSSTDMILELDEEGEEMVLKTTWAAWWFNI